MNTAADAADAVSFHMEKIQRLFKPGAKITVLVRSPHVPGDADFLMTDDDLNEVIEAVKRRQIAGASS